MKYYENILDTIGHTPLVRMNRIFGDSKGLCLAKVEAFNPGGSVKDRIGVNMINAAEREGHLVRSVLRPEKGGDGRGDSAGAFGAPGIEVETASSLEVEILRGVREQRQPAEGPHQMEHGLDRGVGEVVGQGADG